MLNATEIIITTILAAGLLTYLFRPKYKSKKLMLLTKYRRMRTKSLSLQDVLSNHILSNDMIHEEITPGMSYKEFLTELKKTHLNCLSEKTYIKLKKSRNILFLNKVNRVLDDCEEQLIDIEKKLLAVTKNSPVYN